MYIAADDAQKQSFWLAGSAAVLQLLQVLFKFDAVAACIREDLELESRLVIAISKFTADRPDTKSKTELVKDSDELEAWVTPLSSRFATSLLDNLSQQATDTAGTTARRSSKLKLVKHILLSYIKPLFTSTPHPMLNPETGRKLDRRRGGELFGDSYLDGEWKGRAGDDGSSGAAGCWRVYLYLLTLIDVSNPSVLSILNDR